MPDSTPMTHTASCHCGAVRIELDALPDSVTACNCSLCTCYGVLWAYCDAAQIVALPAASLTRTYAWNGRNVDFHHCAHCGCVTHWTPRDPGRVRRGINARLFPPAVLATLRVRHRDGAGTGKYLD